MYIMMRGNQVVVVLMCMCLCRCAYVCEQALNCLLTMILITISLVNYNLFFV